MTFSTFLAKLADPAVEQVTIVALGDSNTELTWHTHGHLNWVGLLHEALFEQYGRNRVIMINAGKCGDTTPGGLTRLDRDVLRFAPDLVIMAFGMNDGGNTAEALQTFREAMAALITRCHAAGAAVLLRTPNPVLLSPLAAHLSGRVAGQEISEASKASIVRTLVDLGQEYDCPVVDHYTRWLDDALPLPKENPNTRWLRMSDETHPGAQGHLAFYRELAPLFGLPVTFPWEA
jgi:lysophospholipase L1-like esterase